MEDVPVFRASKKRKFARQRETSEDNDAETQRSENRQVQEAPNAITGDDETSIANVIRLRKQSKLRGGVQFSNLKAKPEDIDPESMALTLAEPKEDSLQNISNRFVGSTGNQVADIDKHMMAYIDSEIAKRRTNTTQSTLTTNQEDDEYTSSDSESDQRMLTTTTHPVSKTKAPYATQNPLSEFDLGPQAHDINLARTTAAISRAQSGLPANIPEEAGRKVPRRPRKPRLGRDGKPLRPRPRKRRDSSDIARDALVEQVLHEHRLNDATGLSSSTKTTGLTRDEDADEVLAEQFRQEFMDAMAERQQRNQNMAKGKVMKGQETQVQGPKLGGSRSARAKMQASMQTGGEKK